MGTLWGYGTETQSPGGLILGPRGPGGLHVEGEEKPSQSLRREHGLVEFLKTALLKCLCVT